MRVFVFSFGLVALSACATSTEPELTGDTPVVGPPPSAAEARPGTPEAPNVETPDPEVTASLPPAGALSIGGGYRGVNDQCRRTGVTPVTAPFADRDSDLVACPIDFSGRPAFIQGTNSREVTRTSDWVVYSVPLFGEAPVNTFAAPPAITGG